MKSRGLTRRLLEAGASFFRIATIGLFLMAGCGDPGHSPSFAETRFASPEEIEMNFNGRPFVLGENNQIALVRPPDWSNDRFLKLPFWLGANVLVPGVMQPKEGSYYVISEARLEHRLDSPNEWLIEAGSSLLKKDTIFITNRTRYRSGGIMLPTIVQFTGMRKVPKPGGGFAELPVLREVSLPMQWTLKGNIPRTYAHFDTK